MAETYVLQLNPAEIHPKMSKKALQALAETRAAEIINQIDIANKRIEDAKEKAKEANKMESGGLFGGKTKKKVDVQGEALVKTNEAVAQLNTFIQHSIAYTETSVQFSQIMHKTMTDMMQNGFKDKDGQIRKLTDDSNKSVKYIIDKLNDYGKQQKMIEKKHKKIEKDQVEIRDIVEAVKQKATRNFREKSKIDNEQNMKIEAIDDTLKKQGKSIKKTDDDLKLIGKKIKILFILSISALFISICALLFFILFYGKIINRS